MCILHENAKNKLPVIDRFFWHRSRKPGGTGGDWNFPLLQKTPFFLLVTAEISQVAPGLAKFTYLTKMAFFGKFVMVPKLEIKWCCVMPVTQAVCHSKLTF